MGWCVGCSLAWVRQGRAQIAQSSLYPLQTVAQSGPTSAARTALIATLAQPPSKGVAGCFHQLDASHAPHAPHAAQIRRPPLTASKPFVKALPTEGVGLLFGIPGEENLDLLEALRGSSIRLVLTRHEPVAGFMAATYETG